MHADNYIEIDGEYGPIYVSYVVPHHNGTPSLKMVAVKCPDHIVWDDNGKWWPEPHVVDDVIPRARATAELLGVPPYEYLTKVRRSNIWAIEKEYKPNEPVSMMMHFVDSDDYDGKYDYCV